MLGNSMWFSSVIAVAIAFAGTATSLLISPTPASHPGLKLKPGNLFLPKDSRQLLRKLPALRNAILVSTVFWFIGGVTQPSVNSLGEHVFSMSKTRTSLMAASIGIGIAIGCAIAGFFGKKEDSGTRWVRRGSWMTTASLALIALLSSGFAGMPVPDDPNSAGTWQALFQADKVEWMMRASMMLLGISAGIFVVPIQVYIQEAPPPELKGRMIGAQNLLTWIGILLSAGFLAAINKLIAVMSADGVGHHNRFLIFAALAIVMLPIACFFKLETVSQVSPQSADPQPT
jgi:acyl-[acyl-carrier-protein]-phospholipid O-acyltransferase/long-chain-fatty-acid--[acyl-carrier-protein] ligase